MQTESPESIARLTPLLNFGRSAVAKARGKRKVRGRWATSGLITGVYPRPNETPYTTLKGEKEIRIYWGVRKRFSNTEHRILIQRRVRGGVKA